MVEAFWFPEDLVCSGEWRFLSRWLLLCEPVLADLSLVLFAFEEEEDELLDLDLDSDRDREWRWCLLLVFFCFLCRDLDLDLELCRELEREDTLERLFDFLPMYRAYQRIFNLLPRIFNLRMCLLTHERTNTELFNLSMCSIYYIGPMRPITSP